MLFFADKKSAFFDYQSYIEVFYECTGKNFKSKNWAR